MEPNIAQIPGEQVAFVTWQLARTDAVPAWLAEPRIAQLVEDALHQGASVRRLFRLHAWVILPGSLQAVVEPYCQLSCITQWLNERTSPRANAILGRCGAPLWRPEPEHYWIRSRKELAQAIGDMVERRAPVN
jgi:hypothetical protein